MNNFERGSLWRRWDLHVHTPETKKEDRYDGSNPEEKWDKFITSINNYDKEISVIGITDYLSIDNYLKFKEKLDKGLIKKNFDLVLPNVELRISPIATDSPVNIHCIFNPDIIDHLNDWFFSELKFGSNQNSYSANRKELIRLGRDYKQNQSLNERSALFEGIGQFVLQLSDLQEVFQHRQLRENTIIAVSNRDGDGASGIVKHEDYLTGEQGSQLDSTRFNIYSFSDAIFTSSGSSRKYFLGKGADDEEELQNKIGGLMPCIHGSDAHSNKDLFEPNKKRYCWIKANPTFQGLKQILYEPEERVRIQESKPDDKSIYQVIDSIKYQDNNFMPKELKLNQNLVTIIGGKSTGKSLLLRNIANTIDPSEVETKIREASLPGYNKTINSFEVKWRDGQVQKKSDQQSITKKIIYIPQSYLNRLIDIQENQSPIDEIIKTILQQEETVKQAYESLESNFRDTEKTISSLINDLFFKIDDLRTKRKDIKEIGDKKGIEDEIGRLESLVKKLETESELSEEELEKYDDLKKDLNIIEKKLSKFESDVEYLEKLEIQTTFRNFDFSLLSKFNFDELKTGFDKLRRETDKKWIKLVKDRIQKTDQKLRSDREKKQKILSDFEPLKEKVSKTKTLNDKIQKLDAEKEKLSLIESEEQKLKRIKEEISSHIDKLIEAHDKYYSHLSDAKGTIIKSHNIGEDLNFNLDIVFRQKSFNKEFIEQILNLRYVNQFDAVELDPFEFTDKGNYKTDLKNIIHGTLEDKLILKQSYTKKEAITKLLSPWHLFDYNISKDGDNISEMSPGKKSFVLLKLLIDLDNSKCPILLDQPEDDLDNRSIYIDLVEFIKSKKKQRQIIIVTHNPNLVVSSDSEQVIVANQHGVQNPNKDYQFEYISGSLENSFSKNDHAYTLTGQGIQEHVCDILEGGRKAFENRRNKYRMS